MRSSHNFVVLGALETHGTMRSGSNTKVLAQRVLEVLQNLAVHGRT